MSGRRADVTRRAVPDLLEHVYRIVYANIHTDAYPSDELRGQLIKALTEADYRKAAQGGGFTGNIIVGTDLASVRLPAK